MTDNEFSILMIRFLDRFYKSYKTLSLGALWNFLDDERERLKNEVSERKP